MKKNIKNIKYLEDTGNQVPCRLPLIAPGTDSDGPREPGLIFMGEPYKMLPRDHRETGGPLVAFRQKLSERGKIRTVWFDFLKTHP